MYKNLLPVLPSEIFLLLISPLPAPKSLGPKLENAEYVSSSEPRPAQESKGHEKKEHEGITVRSFQSTSMCH